MLQREKDAHRIFDISLMVSLANEMALVKRDLPPAGKIAEQEVH